MLSGKNGRKFGGGEERKERKGEEKGDEKKDGILQRKRKVD